MNPRLWRRKMRQVTDHEAKNCLFIGIWGVCAAGIGTWVLWGRKGAAVVLLFLSALAVYTAWVGVSEPKPQPEDEETSNP